MAGHRFLVLICLLVALPTLADEPYRGGAVATAYPKATEAALSMMNKGGNAVDAAVAAAFVAGVVAPYHNGIGGGGFAVLHTRAGKEGDAKDEAFDFREIAPAHASHDMYLKDGKPVPHLSTDGALSVAVPGAAAGYVMLQRKYGKLPLPTVMAPAIALAQKGFWVSPKYQSMAKARVDCLRQDPEATRLFLRPNAQGTPDVPAIGTLLQQPELARTLRLLAAHGAKAFYQGPVAQKIAATLAAHHGVLDAKDLAAYQPRWRAPLTGSYRGHRIVGMPPPSAGGFTVLEVLGQLEALRPDGLPYREPESIHLLTEAMRRSYVDRVKYLGDPSVMKTPVEQLLTPAHFAALAKTIDLHHATPSKELLAAAQPDDPAMPHHTTHLSVIDKDGNAVALTTTLNYGFGSCLVAKGTGVLLNDEMDDFAAQPLTPNVFGLVTGESNAVRPGKTPLSSMSPTLVFQKDHPDQVMLAVGSPGGPTIPTSTLQVILHVIDQGMSVQRAVDAGRIHNQYLPDALFYEKDALEPATRRALEGMGHVLKEVPVLGTVEAVYVDPITHLRYAGTDPRAEGAAAGQD